MSLFRNYLFLCCALGSIGKDFPYIVSLMCWLLSDYFLLQWISLPDIFQSIPFKKAANSFSNFVPRSVSDKSFLKSFLTPSIFQTLRRNSSITFLPLSGKSFIVMFLKPLEVTCLSEYSNGSLGNLFFYSKVIL